MKAYLLLNKMLHHVFEVYHSLVVKMTHFRCKNMFVIFNST